MNILIYALVLFTLMSSTSCAQEAEEKNTDVKNTNSGAMETDIKDAPNTVAKNTVVKDPAAARASLDSPEVRKGLMFYEKWQADSALHYLIPAYQASPTNVKIALAVAEASLWKKDFKTATTILSQLENPNTPEANRVRGILFEQANRLSEALAMYNKAIPKLNLPWGTMERKAKVLSWLKRYEESKKVYHKIIASDVASDELKIRCEIQVAQLTAWEKDLPGALKKLRNVLQKDPKNIEALMLQAQIQEWSGDFQEAKASYEKVLEIDSSHNTARLKLDKLQWVN